MKRRYRKYFSLFLAILILFSSIPFTPSPVVAATTQKRVTETAKVRPGFYWCQHRDGHWSIAVKTNQFFKC